MSNFTYPDLLLNIVFTTLWLYLDGVSIGKLKELADATWVMSHDQWLQIIPEFIYLLVSAHEGHIIDQFDDEAK